MTHFRATQRSIILMNGHRVTSLSAAEKIQELIRCHADSNGAVSLVEAYLENIAEILLEQRTILSGLRKEIAALQETLYESQEESESQTGSSQDSDTPYLKPQELERLVRSYSEATVSSTQKQH